MPKKIVSYKKNNIDHKIEMSWKIFYRDFIVRFDGEVIGTFESQKELNSGRDFVLPIGVVLHVKKTQKFLTVLIESLIDGIPIEGSDSDPRKIVERAYFVSIFLCLINYAFGLLGYFIVLKFLSIHGYGLYNLVLGTLYLIPFCLGVKQKSWLMLLFIFIVFIIDTLAAFYGIYEMSKQGIQVSAVPIVMRFIFGVPLYLGVKAGYDLKYKNKS